MKELKKDKEASSFSVTDLDAIKQNTMDAVEEFARRYISMPRFDIGVEVMDQAAVRDAMGLRATFDYGDPWPAAERELHDRGFRWHLLSGKRVMLLKERDDFVPDTGWQDAQEAD